MTTTYPTNGGSFQLPSGTVDLDNSKTVWTDTSFDATATYRNTAHVTVNNHPIDEDDGEYVCNNCGKSKRIPALEMVEGTSKEAVVRAYALGYFAAAASCKSVSVHATNTVSKFKGRNGEVYTVHQSSDGRYYVTSSRGNTVLVTKDPEEINQFVDSHYKPQTGWQYTGPTTDTDDDTSDTDNKSFFKRLFE